MTTLFTLDAKQHIANSINAQNSLTLKVADFTITNPIAAVTGSYNSKATFTLLPSSGYKGSKDLAFTRFPLSNLLTGKDITLLKPKAGVTTVSGLVDTFNQTFGTQLTANDFVAGDLSQTGNTTLTASDTSLFFIPGGTIDVGFVYPGSARDSELDIYAWPDLVGQLATYGIDYSTTQGKSLFSGIAASGTVLSDAVGDTFASMSNALGGITIFSGGSYQTLGGMRAAVAFSYSLPNAAIPDADQTGRFAKVIVVPPLAGSWFTRPLYFHYNP